MKRTFIYTDDKSNKFWSIEIDGCQFTVNYGKVGTDGQTQTKEFASEAECQKQADKLVVEKTKKGYVEEGADSTIAPKTTTPKAAPKSKPAATPNTSKPAEVDFSAEPTFRQATEADVPMLTAILQRVLKANPIFREDIQKKLEGKQASKQINPDISTIIYLNEVPVGYAMHGEAINSLIIDVPYQRKGFGTKLFNHIYKQVEEAVKQKGTYDYVIAMFYTADEFSKSFYKKQGFVKRAETNMDHVKMYLQMYTKDLPKQKKTAQKPANASEQKKLDDALLTLCKTPNLAHNYEFATKLNELLDKGANPNIKYDDCTTPLFRLLNNNNLHFIENIIAEYLLYSPDLTITDSNGLTVLHYLAKQQQPFIINKYAKKMVDNGANPNALDNEGQTALFHFNTTYGGNSGEAVEALVAAGVDSTIKNKNGQNALAYRASLHCDMGVLLALMRAVPATQTDKEGNTILHLAALAKDDLMSEYFIERVLKSGIDINSQNNKGQTALHLAKEDYLAQIIKCNPDFNIQDNEGNTPLHTHNNNKLDIFYLLQANPDVTLKNKAGISAADYVRSLKVKGNTLDMLDRLEKEGVKTVDKSEIKSGFKPHQVNLNTKSVYTNPVITGSIVLKDNNGESGVSYIGDNQVQVIADHWGEITDVVNLVDSSVWRIPPPPDRRIGKCFIDDNYYYAVSIKGYEAIYQNLIKIDKGTKEEVWTCGLSSYKGRLKFFQDTENIYYTDKKTTFTISKTKGKVLAKHVMVAMNMVTHNNSTMLITYEFTTKKNAECKLMLVNPISGDCVWTTLLKKGEKVKFHTIDGDTLYVVGAKSTVYFIDIKSGKILNTVVLKNVDTDDFYTDEKSEFVKEGDKLYIGLRGWDIQYLITIDTKKNTCIGDDFSEVISGRLSQAPTVKDNCIYAAAKDGVYIYNLKTKEKTACIEAVNYGGKYDVMGLLVLGDTLYMLQQGGLTYKDSSVLHQIKNS